MHVGGASGPIPPNLAGRVVVFFGFFSSPSFYDRVCVSDLASTRVPHYSSFLPTVFVQSSFFFVLLPSRLRPHRTHPVSNRTLSISLCPLVVGTSRQSRYFGKISGSCGQHGPIPPAEGFVSSPITPTVSLLQRCFRTPLLSRCLDRTDHGRYGCVSTVWYSGGGRLLRARCSCM